MAKRKTKAKRKPKPNKTVTKNTKITMFAIARAIEAAKVGHCVKAAKDLKLAYVKRKHLVDLTKLKTKARLVVRSYCH